MTMKGFYVDKMGSRQPDKLVMGRDTTRATSEDCLFAVKGNHPRAQRVIVQSLPHRGLGIQEKPDIVRENLCNVRRCFRIELFARQTSQGFDVWGNQCEGPQANTPWICLDIG